MLRNTVINSWYVIGNEYNRIHEKLHIFGKPPFSHINTFRITFHIRSTRVHLHRHANVSWEGRAIERRKKIATYSSIRIGIDRSANDIVVCVPISRTNATRP